MISHTQTPPLRRSAFILKRIEPLMDRPVNDRLPDERFGLLGLNSYLSPTNGRSSVLPLFDWSEHLRLLMATVLFSPGYGRTENSFRTDTTRSTLAENSSRQTALLPYRVVDFKL